jgi:hypothetical protein
MIRSLILITILAVPAIARAQTPVDWSMQVNVLDAGDRINVKTVDGPTIRGRLQGLDAESITLLRGGRVTRLPASGVLSIERHDSVWNGGAIGLTTGFASGVVMMSTCDPGFMCEHSPEAILMCGALTGGFGFGVGVLFDAIVHGDHTIYRRNDRRVSVVPVVTRQTARLGVTVTF